MEYKATSDNHMEGLTAGLLYDKAAPLFDQHIPPTRVDQQRSRSIPEKLWDIPEIRYQLEEFVQSYLFSNIRQELRIADIFNLDFNDKAQFATLEQNVGEYFRELEGMHGLDEAKEIIYGIFDELNQRRRKLNSEIEKIAELDNDSLYKVLIKDAYAHIAVVGIYIETASEKLDSICS